MPGFETTLGRLGTPSSSAPRFELQVRDLCAGRPDVWRQPQGDHQRGDHVLPGSPRPPLNVVSVDCQEREQTSAFSNAATPDGVAVNKTWTDGNSLYALLFCGCLRRAMAVEEDAHQDAVNRPFSIPNCLIFDSSVDAGTPSLAAAPCRPETFPRLFASAASMISLS
jgi:hypothetical protein